MENKTPYIINIKDYEARAANSLLKYIIYGDYSKAIIYIIQCSLNDLEKQLIKNNYDYNAIDKSKIDRINRIVLDYMNGVHFNNNDVGITKRIIMRYNGDIGNYLADYCDKKGRIGI